MLKKVIFLFVVLCLLGGGFFYSWQKQSDVRELNKNLPEGVRVVKSLFGNDYKVVNKIDEYEFKIPPEWKGLKEIEYFSEEIEQGYTASSISLEGKEGVGRISAIANFKITKSDVNLESWVKNYFENSGVVNNFQKETVGRFEAVKILEFDISLLGYIYFFKNNSMIYAVACGSEELIRYIITNGKW